MFKAGDVVRIKSNGDTRGSYTREYRGALGDFIKYDESGAFAPREVSEIQLHNKNLKRAPYRLYSSDIELDVVPGDDDPDCV